MHKMENPEGKTNQNIAFTYNFPQITHIGKKPTETPKHSLSQVTTSNQRICFGHSIQPSSVTSSGKIWKLAQQKLRGSSQISSLLVLETRTLEHKEVQTLPNDTDFRVTEFQCWFQERKVPNCFKMCYISKMRLVTRLHRTESEELG